MGLTMAEKILASHSGKSRISPGEFVEANIDVAMVHEALGVTGGVADIFRQMGAGKVWDTERVVALLDHWVPAPSPQVADTHRQCREFVKEFRITNWLDMAAGISHQVLPERRMVRPGELIVGTDSHTTTYGAFGALGTGVGVTDMAIVFATGKLWLRVPETIRCVIDGKLHPYIMGKDLIHHVLSLIGADGASYKSIEFYGSAIDELSIDGRMTMANMSVEAGAKDGLIPTDRKTMEYLRSRVSSEIRPIGSDSDAEFLDEIESDVSGLDPQVAKPPSPANSVSVREVEGEEVDEAFIGTCTNGRVEDLEMATRILKGRKVADGTRLVVIPASTEVYLAALKLGLLSTIHEAGGVVEYPTCGPCIGGQLGVIGDGEVAIATMNRNFTGRMGSNKGLVYLASPATVAASAVKGSICDPREFLNA
jgi:3-isopropylmalate/(R)-2-methylmalate dehydratase large subunit